MIRCSMSVTDTKEFIRMETVADKLGVDQVKLVRMMMGRIVISINGGQECGRRS